MTFSEYYGETRRLLFYLHMSFARPPSFGWIHLELLKMSVNLDEGGKD